MPISALLNRNTFITVLCLWDGHITQQVRSSETEVVHLWPRLVFGLLILPSSLFLRSCWRYSSGTCTVEFWYICKRRIFPPFYLRDTHTPRTDIFYSVLLVQWNKKGYRSTLQQAIKKWDPGHADKCFILVSNICTEPYSFTSLEMYRYHKTWVSVCRYWAYDLLCDYIAYTLSCMSFVNFWIIVITYFDFMVA